jgi:hypothetical protein
MAKRRKAARKRKSARRGSRANQDQVNSFWAVVVIAAIGIAIVANYLTTQNAAAKKASLMPAPLVNMAPGKKA